MKHFSTYIISLSFVISACSPGVTEVFNPASNDAGTSDAAPPGPLDVSITPRTPDASQDPVDEGPPAIDSTTGIDTADVAGTPQWDGIASAIPDTVRDQMRGKSWHADLACPSFDELALLQLPYYDFAGQVQRGELVVAADVATDILAVFQSMFGAQFPIERMELVHNYGGDDDASMAANNTSAFNCRAVTGGTSLSEHSYGAAIDINPVQNPYVRNATVLPDAGRAYLDRTDVRPGMIVRPDVVTDAFEAIGWTWGGDFSSLKDYQHFSRDGG